MPKVTAQYLEARKDEILDAAQACFLRRGFHQTTMQDICREAELSPGAVYRYFKSKEEIIGAAIDRNTAEYAALISSVRSQAPSPNQALEMIGRYFFGQFQEPDFEAESRMDIECWPELLRDERSLAAIRRQFTTIREAFVDLFRQAQTEGHLSGAQGVQPEHVYSLVVAVYQGLRINSLIDPESTDPAEVLNTLLSLLGRPETEPAAALPAEKGS